MQILIWQAKSQKKSWWLLSENFKRSCLYTWLTTLWSINFNTFVYLGHDKLKFGKKKSKQKRQQKPQSYQLNFWKENTCWKYSYLEFRLGRQGFILFCLIRGDRYLYESTNLPSVWLPGVEGKGWNPC